VEKEKGKEKGKEQNSDNNNESEGENLGYSHPSLVVLSKKSPHLSPAFSLSLYSKY
jgi:hypothetical protein